LMYQLFIYIKFFSLNKRLEKKQCEIHNENHTAF